MAMVRAGDVAGVAACAKWVMPASARPNSNDAPRISAVRARWPGHPVPACQLGAGPCRCRRGTGCPACLGTLAGPSVFRSHRGWRSEEHTSELQSLMRISYAVFCLKKKKNKIQTKHHMRQINRKTKNPHHNIPAQSHKTQPYTQLT